MNADKSDILTLLRDTTIFSNLDDDALMELAAFFSLLRLPADAWLYRKGDATSGFYLLKDGEAAVLAGNTDSLEENLILLAGDFAGEEAIFYIPKRQASVKLKGDVELLFLSNEHVSQLIEKHPEVRTKTSILAESRKLSHRVKMPWLIENEYVQIITRKHPILLLGGMTIPVVFFGVFVLVLSALSQTWFQNAFTWTVILLIGFGISVLWLVWNIINWANDYYIVTNKRMVWVEKVAGFYDSRQEAPLSTLLSVGTRRTRLGNLLGYADVSVRTFVGNIQFRNVKHAKEIGQVIESYWERLKASDLTDEGIAMQRALREKLELPVDEDLIPIETTLEKEEIGEDKKVREVNFFEWLFSDFLKVRYDVGGTTIYRKHWFTLIKGTALPMILFLLSILLTAAVATYRITFLSRAPALVVSGLLLAGTFLWLVYQYVDWRNDIFQLTDDQVVDIDRKPFGKELRRTAPLENILSIEYERLGLFGILFNFGTVYITVGNTKLSFDHVYNPSEVQQDIFARMGTRLEEKRRISVTQERERISEWFKVYHEQFEGFKKISEDETQKIQDSDISSDG
jgi:uncharacterized membrane protein YdbT with pleckstrin-like domain